MAVDTHTHLRGMRQQGGERWGGGCVSTHWAAAGGVRRYYLRKKKPVSGAVSSWLFLSSEQRRWRLQWPGR